MEKSQILEEVQVIFRDVLDNEDIVLEDTTTADDIEEWDSLSHVQLVVAIEKYFQIKFTSSELLCWNRIGDLVECINNKL